MATKKAFVSGHNYIQDIHMEAGIYTVLMKVKSMYGDVCSFALFDGTTWTHYDMDTVQGQWKWAYVTFRTLVPMTKINLISRNYSTALPVYVVEPQIVAGNVPFDAGVSPADLNKESKELQSILQSMEYLKLAIGQDSQLEGALFTLVTILLKEDMNADVTAGVSGIQGAGRNLPAFWAGGTYAEALADAAKIILRHNGTGKIGVFEVDEAGSVKIYDPDIADLLRLEFIKSKVPTVASLMSQTQEGQSVTNLARIFTSSGSAVLPNSINVTEEGSELSFQGMMDLYADFSELNGSTSGMASASVALYKDGYHYANLRTLNSGELSDSNYSYGNYVLINKKLTVPKGVYTIVVSAYFDDAIGSAGISSTSTLSWILRKDIRRFIFGSDGFASWYKDNSFHFSELTGVFARGKVDMPGVLASGTVSTSGGLSNEWGAKVNYGQTITGGYRIYLKDMTHNKYSVHVTPHTNTTFRVSNKTNTYFEILGNGAADFAVFGSNYEIEKG